MTISRKICLALLAPLTALGLGGCVSFGEDPPDTLFNLSSTARAPAGTGSNGTAQDAIVVLTPEAPRMLDVVRVPVQVDDSAVAYLKDAVWVEKPTRLFSRLLSETLRAGGKRFVVEGADVQYSAGTRLSGRLLEMGYNAPLGAVVVRYDAILQLPDGQIRTQRFEAEVPGVEAEAAEVAPALNEAANRVAAEVAAWVG